MNILHLTDFHFQNKGKDPSRIINAIIQKIQLEKIAIDLIFFTGDLVNIGGEQAPYLSAKEALFKPIVEKLNIDWNDIIMCPGNHDINRLKISKSLNSYINSQFTNNDKLNSFCAEKNNTDYNNSIQPTAPFKSFLSDFYSDKNNNDILDLYSIHKRTIRNKEIVVVSINTAWLSGVFDDDKGNLLFPTELLHDICKQVKGCNQKIILMHHPLYFLREFNLPDVENIIHSEFNLLFSGHIHKTSSLSRHNGTNGIFEHIATASLTSEGRQGCSIVKIDDISDNQISVREIIYIDESSSCTILDEINHSIPCGNDKIEILKFRQKLYNKVSIEKENANDLLLLSDDDNSKDFLTLYNHPVLKKESDNNLESKTTPTIGFEELISSETNFLILGKDKCGKTSLLKRLQIEHLINFTRNGKIPFYIDAKEHEQRIDDKFSIENLIKNYYDISKNKVAEKLSSANFIILIDNYSPESAFSMYLEGFLAKYDKIQFIICSEENLARTMDIIPLGNIAFEKLFFHKLRKQEIVQYIEKRLEVNSKKEEVRQRIIALCAQLELPLNYWTISLLLLIHSKSSESYSKNLFSILDICIDEIFNKRQMLLSRSKISYEQLKKICAELAKIMFEHHSATVYSLTETEILRYIENIIAKNDRISASEQTVFEYLCSCGVIKQKNDDHRYVFRLNGFFEYFLAYQMTKDHSFRNDIIKDDHMFISFKNQIEIYSGFKRDDHEFLNAIFNKVKQKVDPTLKKYNQDKDAELLQQIKAKRELEQFCKNLSITRTLSAIEKAKIEDQFEEPQIDSEVHAIEKINIDNITYELLERYISILARTFRSSDEITDKQQENDEIFDYIIDSYCNLGYHIIEEFKNFAKIEFESGQMSNMQDFPELELLNYVSNFTPLICQASLFDGVGHFSLEKVILTKIDKIKQSTNIQEYKLFMLCFLLLDIDLEKNKEYINIAMQYIKIPILKYAIMIKLNFYLAFKGGENKNLQKQLSSYIQQARLNLDNKTNIYSIHKQIQAKKKASLINKHSQL